MNKIKGHDKNYIDYMKIVRDHSPKKTQSYKSTTMRALGNIYT